MKQIKMKDIKFFSYCKLNAIIWGSIGLVLGLLFFAISLFGGNARAYWGTYEITGVAAGAISLIMAPLITIVMAFFLSLISYVPFSIITSILKGIRIAGKFENVEHDNHPDLSQETIPEITKQEDEND
ncbi:hypothetical protein [Gorillibacterium sp. sgz5001074]|uniref:hypothetical protein n=1 Tax=Gorillibacterium sp. sgz5001074 TaxID=3446695 RepID=UPI003F66352D